MQPRLESQGAAETTRSNEKGKDYYSEYFAIGVAVTPRLRGEAAALGRQHFNSLTTENAMKMGLFIPGRIITSGMTPTLLLVLPKGTD